MGKGPACEMSDDQGRGMKTFGEYDVECALIFSQKPRVWLDANTGDSLGYAFNACLLDYDRQPPLILDDSRAMSKRQRKVVQDGVDHLKRQKKAFEENRKKALEEKKGSGRLRGRQSSNGIF